jgi:nucleoside-diphosphate-sugar epimerase
VTGCAGFVGSHLTERLLERGCEVIGVDCFNDNYGRREKLLNLEAARSWDNFDFLPLDLARGDLSEIVADCETVFHLAAEPGVRASWGVRFETYVRNNVVATQLLLDEVKQAGSRVVYASSSSIYGQAETFPTSEAATPRPFSPYGVTKLAAEHLCSAYNENFGVPTTSLRFFTVYGPRQRPDMAFTRFLTAIHRGEPITVYGDGHQSRDFTYVADIVDALLASSVRDEAVGQIFNLGGGSQVELLDVIRTMENVSGQSVRVNFADSQAGDVRKTGADTALARELIDFSPSVSVAEGIANQFAWITESSQKQST